MNLLHPRFGKRTSLLVLGMLLLQPQRSIVAAEPQLKLNDQEYLEMPGLNVMLAHDYYPESHQGGVSIIQNGQRVATNGDLRLDRTPGQWQPVAAKIGERLLDRQSGTIGLRLKYPDESRNRKGFNPIDYPDLEFSYVVSVRPQGQSVIVTVDLDKPLPAEWNGKVAFLLELFPGVLFGKSYYMDAESGIFPRQANGPGHLDSKGDFQIDALARGRRLVVAPESDRQRMTIEATEGGDLELIDGRGQHSNGWFVVRAVLTPGATKRALEWKITPHVLDNWKSEPVIQVSQVGYHPAQPKVAIVELDASDTAAEPLVVSRVEPSGELKQVSTHQAEDWGRFLRFRYKRLDFSDVTAPGMYVVSYGDQRSHVFKIGPDVYQRHVWQPTLEYFLPIQMCHMRVNDRYRVWHDACHLDDARMAPVNHNHFDGYLQGPDTLTSFRPGQHVPGLNVGGWHDAGDDDLRIESQASTVYGLALAYEAFHVDYDDTTVDQVHRVVELHRPDGKPDILQQVEHGVLTIAGSYESLGRMYRGIITPTLRQYTTLGDPATETDGKAFDPTQAAGQMSPVGQPGSPDDRWVFTEDNPQHELIAAASLAAASRVLKDYNPALAKECLQIAEQLWQRVQTDQPVMKTQLAVELLLATGDKTYADFLIQNKQAIAGDFEQVGWVLGRVKDKIDDEPYQAQIRLAAGQFAKKIDELQQKTPYGVPYEPNIWGAGWIIQGFGARQYFLHEAYPDLFSLDSMFNALNFVLGCHPGANTASFVSGVGAESTTVAYGFNRADWTYIPGGSASGTALIRPDYPELLVWPYLWQQTEYVIGGGTTDYLTLVLAADHVLNKEK
jgi:endoglucanase